MPLGFNWLFRAAMMHSGDVCQLRIQVVGCALCILNGKNRPTIAGRTWDLADVRKWQIGPTTNHEIARVARFLRQGANASHQTSGAKKNSTSLKNNAIQRQQKLDRRRITWQDRIWKALSKFCEDWQP